MFTFFAFIRKVIQSLIISVPLVQKIYNLEIQSKCVKILYSWQLTYTSVRIVVSVPLVL